MIARDDDLDRVRQRAEEIGRARELVERTVLEQVASVHEDVTVGDDEPVVLQVRVGERDDAHGSRQK